MSIVNVRQIETKLKKTYKKRIDMSDVSTFAPADQESMFNSRALAVFALESLTGETISGACVTDGFDDNGIDVIYCDSRASKIWVCQSKWIRSGTGEPATADTLKFLKGVEHLLEYRFTKFNKRTQKIKKTVKAILDNAEATINLVMAYTGNQFGTHNQELIDDFLSVQNDVSEVAVFHKMDLKELHKFLLSGVRGKAVTAVIRLAEYGMIENPLTAYYGYIASSDIHQLWHQHGTQLFIENLREYMGDTDVNEGIQHTLLNAPAHLFYRNNGITIIAKSIKKTLAGGSDRKAGEFVCEEMSVINGAQTVGCIGAVRPDQVGSLDTAKLLCRLIEYGEDDGTVAVELTRACNTQNSVQAKDFVSLLEDQKRIAAEMALDKKQYLFRSGVDTPSDKSQECTIEEATIALACRNADVNLTVIAKTKVSRLWNDQKVYPRIFNSNVSAALVWNSVEFMRVVDDEVAKLVEADDDLTAPVAVHGNRFILHLMFRVFDKELRKQESLNKNTLRATVRKILKLTSKLIQDTYPKAAMYSLFKNLTKTKFLSEKVILQVSR